MIDIITHQHTIVAIMVGLALFAFLPRTCTWIAAMLLLGPLYGTIATVVVVLAVESVL